MQSKFIVGETKKAKMGGLNPSLKIERQSTKFTVAKNWSK